MADKNLKKFDNITYKGIEDYINFVDEAYTSNASSSSLDERDRTMDEYKGEIRTLFNTKKIEKLYFDNILIRENWAALHYRFRNKTVGNDEKTVASSMLHGCNGLRHCSERRNMFRR